MVETVSEEKALSRIERIPALIQSAESADDVHKLWLEADALRRLCKKKRLEAVVRSDHAATERWFSEQNKCAQYRLLAERKLGEELAGMDKHKGGRPAEENPGHDVRSKYRDLGIRYKQAERWQKAAKVPAKRFDDYCKKTIEDGREITSSGILRIAKEIEQEKKREENEKLVEECPSIEAVLGESRFPTIAIDPPWDFKDEGDENVYGRTRPTYKQMPFEEIFGLPVGTFAEDNAHIYLWITNRSMPKGFTLLERWGFRHVTILTWCKPSIGVGNYFRNNTEHVLFGVKGKLGLLRSDVGTWFQAARGQKGHSSKPVEFYELVESSSPGPWCELFSRGGRPGWASWGAEA